ncbi:hypothetical protein BFP72_02450 [Reichenbachiella sp. 5M10]|uniref:DUF1266 domain-containing protein n=1 Tax=Reichenbachiella sp. 5M10 TaxID=1889772 RepID=UPI000C155ADD|nr:DUF1266 domain-containing protein [Reichenbachiella sp. 5M10]PIB34361.1 hypothetical protein BFP72_02450 [Reichenbachiella sp. 5M10]
MVFKYENPDQLSEKQLWLLGTSAMLAQLNDQRHDTINPKGDYTHPELVENIQHVLTRDWEISNLADLSDTVKYLHEKVTLAQDQHSWQVLSRLELESAAQNDSIGSYRNVMDMIKNYRAYERSSDFAWHYGRCTWLIRMSYFLDYINEAEAWALMEDNGQKIKERFSSWADFGLSYMMGAQYWKRNSYTPDAVYRYKRQYLSLMTHQDSPWKNIPWEVEV